MPAQPSPHPRRRGVRSDRVRRAGGEDVGRDAQKRLVGAGAGPTCSTPELGDDAPARRPLQEAELEQVRLVDVLDRVRLLAERHRERREPDRAAAELLDDRAQQLAVEPLEAGLVDLEQLERLLGDLARDDAGVAHLGDVAHAPQDAVRDPRRAARAARDLVGGVVSISTPRMRALRRTIAASSSGRVVVEPERQAEAVAQRRRQQPGARRRADQRERRQVERERARRRPLADDDVEPEVLERRIEDLLDRAVEAVDLVDEEDVAGLERRQDRGDVALALERRPGDLADADAELSADDLRERRLAEPGRARRAARGRAPRRAPCAASSAIASCSLTRSWPTKSPSGPGGATARAPPRLRRASDGGEQRSLMPPASAPRAPAPRR